MEIKKNFSSAEEAFSALSEDMQAHNLSELLFIIVEQNLQGDATISISKNGVPIAEQPSFSEQDGVYTAAHSFTPGSADYDGSYTVTVSGTDMAGNASSTTRSFLLDATAPEITEISYRKGTSGSFSQLQDDAVFDSNIQVQLTVSDANSDKINWSFAPDESAGGTVGTNLDGSAPIVNGTALIPVSALFKGTLTFTAVDMAGNAKTASRSFTLDNGEVTPPVITAKEGDSAYNGNWTNQSITLTIAGGEALSGIAGYEYKIGEGDWVAYTGPITVSANSDASYYARAVSKSGGYSASSLGTAVRVLSSIEAPALVVSGNQSVSVGYTNWYLNGSVIQLTNQQLVGAENITFQYKIDQAETWEDAAGASIPLRDGVYTYSIRAIAFGGTVFSNTISITVSAETAAPTVSASMTSKGDFYTAGDWTEDSVNISPFGASASGISHYLISGDDGVSWAEVPFGGTYTAQTTGAYLVKAVSNAGNESAQSSVQINIDREPVTINISYYYKDDSQASGVTVDGRLWFGRSVKLLAAASAGSSEVESFEYKIGDGEWQAVSENITIPDNVAAAVQFKAINGAGKEKTESTPILGVDKAAPTASIYAEPAGWTNGRVTLTVAAGDSGSGLNPTAYSYDGGSSWTNIPTTTVNANGVAVVRVRDAVGNWADVSFTVDKIDRVAPSISSVSTGAYTGGWVSGDVTLTVNASDDASGVTLYSFDNGVTWQDSNVYIVNTDMNGDLFFKVKDAAGNVSTAMAVNVKRDTAAPIISSVTVSPDSWTKDSATVFVTATDGAASGGLTYSFDAGNTWQSGNSKLYDTEQETVVAVQVRDIAGNVAVATAQQQVTVRVDKTPPIITSLQYALVNNDIVSNILNNLTGGMLFRQQIEVSAQASDAHFATLSFSIDGNPISDTTTSGSTDKTTLTFRVSPQFKGTVTVTAADLAGNVAVETADVTLDSAGPTRPYITVDGRLVSDPSSGVLVEMPWTFADTTVSADGSTALSGIKEYAYANTSSEAPLTISSDGKFTMYTEYAYSGDRFQLDTVEYDENGDPILVDEEGNVITREQLDEILANNPDANEENYYKRNPLKVDKLLQLAGPGGGVSFPKGTQVTMIDLDTQETYVYSVSTEEEAAIHFSDFKTMNTRQAYQEKDVSKESELSKTTYQFMKGGRVLTDGNAGLERFLILVNFANTQADDTATVATVQPRVWNNQNTEDKTFGIDTSYVSAQSYLTIGQRRSLHIRQAGTAASFSAGIPLVVNLELQDSVTLGYDYSYDYVNKSEPYLEVAYAITSDPEGQNVVDIPLGTLIRYGGSDAQYTKSTTGQVLFFRDQENSEYDMSKVDFTNSQTLTSNVSLALDFSKAVQFPYTNTNYYLRVTLYRTADQSYPMGGGAIQTLLIPISVESNAEYGLRLDAAEESLNKNLNELTEENAVAPLSFTANYSNIADGSENTKVVYKLYKRGSDGAYALCPGESDGLSVAMGYADGSLITRPFKDSMAEFNLWYYKEGEGGGAASYSETASYLSGSDEVVVGTVNLTVYQGKISSITVKSGEQDITASYQSIINTIKNGNGTSGVIQSMDDSQKAVVKAVSNILLKARTSATTGGTGENSMSLSGFRQNMSLGNYKLTATLTVNGVAVAEDFFVFNVNKNYAHSAVQP